MNIEFLCRKELLFRILFISHFLVLIPSISLAQNNDQATLEWLKQHTVPIQTVEPNHGFDDLQILKHVVGDARIVELGEATHGTREFFQFKHRMVEFLASQKGFTIFSIEANMPEAYRLNDYVLNGNGDPKELLKGMYFWTWNTEEVLEMINWMRAFNASGKGRIEFTGFDMQTPTVSIELVKKFVKEKDPTYYSETLKPLLNEIAYMENPPGSLGVVSALLPIEMVRGKHLKLEGYIRTQDLTDGYAGLWLRADGSQGIQVLENMQNHGATGSTDWKRYEISIDVPVNATKVLFGALQNGKGTAWFDSLQIEIDGVSYSDTSAFDLDFESNSLRGFHVGGNGYVVLLDNTVAQSGKQSLRIKKMDAANPKQNKQEIEAAHLLECSAVVKYLEDHRAKYLETGVAPKEMEWIIQNARLILQYVQLKAGTKSRDESMAENVRWIAEQNPSAKLIVWAHNGHISNKDYAGGLSMGSFLRKAYGDQLINFGFAFNEGSFQAIEMGKNLHNFTVNAASEGTLDRMLSNVGIPIYVIDLRNIPKEGPVAQWFSELHRSRSIGAAYSDTLEPYLWSTNPVRDDYDVLFFVEKTTAAHPIQNSSPTNSP